jgi:hypothetical protein
VCVGGCRALEADGLIFNDHPYRDKCENLEDALRNFQFRFQDVPLLSEQEGEGGKVVKAGKLLYRMGHEMRSMHHPRFMRDVLT